MSQTAITALKRLTRGKTKLSEEEFGELVRFVKQTSEPELLQAAFPPPKASKAAPKPPWLKDMEAARRKIAWASPSEAVGKLYEVARGAGYASSTPREKSFPKAALQISAVIGEARLRAAFANWVSGHVAHRTPG